VSGDAVDVVARLKEEFEVPLRSHGSLSLNRALMGAGLVDRVQVTLLPVITGPASVTGKHSPNLRFRSKPLLHFHNGPDRTYAEGGPATAAFAVAAQRRAAVAELARRLRSDRIAMNWASC
jgi:hypothetical protein